MAGVPLAAIDWVLRVRSVWDRRGSRDADAAAKTVDYLSRYANRVAISNGRLVKIDGQDVLFRYKDYRDGNQWKTNRMPGVEFIGRFLQHVFPQRLRHIRRFGFMAPRVAAEKLEQIRALLGVPTQRSGAMPAPAGDSWMGDSDVQGDADADLQDADQPKPRRCRSCGIGTFVLIGETPRPTVAELLRMPPTMEPAAESTEVEEDLALSARL